MNWSSITSIFSDIVGGLFKLVSTVDPALISHNKNHIDSAVSALKSVASVAPEVESAVNTAASIAAAVDPGAANAVEQVAKATTAIGNAISTLTPANVVPTAGTPAS